MRDEDREGRSSRPLRAESFLSSFILPRSASDDLGVAQFGRSAPLGRERPKVRILLPRLFRVQVAERQLR
jgi:hypothetical protein